MSERQTGATVEQILAAAERWWNSNATNHHWTQKAPEEQALWCEATERFASALVPPGQVITDAARVPTDDELAAIRAIVADDGVPAESDEWFAAFDTLRAYLERQR